MPLTVAVQMDPIERIRIAGDSTFALLLEAQARGHKLLHYTPDRLQLNGKRVEAVTEPLSVKDVEGDHARLGKASLTDLSSVDVVLLRQDPPFDLAYIATTHILERIQPKTLVVNDPSGVRNAPEKLFVMDFPELMPPTPIARDKAAIEGFRAQHGEVVMKPLYGFGGAAEETDLTERERAICSTIGPELRKRGLLFVGLDVIDGYLTEINVTSPTGIRAVKRLGGPDLAVSIWDAIEAKLNKAMAF